MFYEEIKKKKKKEKTIPFLACLYEFIGRAVALPCLSSLAFAGSVALAWTKC